MKRFVVACVTVLLSVMSPGQSGSKPKHEPHLQAIDWLTRGTWTAKFATPTGKPFVIQSQIRWADTGNAIYFLSRFQHQPHYYGIYVYDPAAKQIKFFYTSVDGEYASGYAQPSATQIKQDFQISTAKGATSYFSLIKRVGEDAYDLAVYQEGNEKQVVSVHYIRK